MCVCVCFSLQVPTATVLVSIIWGSDKYMSIFASWDGRTRSSVIWLRVVGWLVGWLAGFWCLLWSVWPCSFCKDIESIWCRATSMADSVIPSDRVIIRYMPTGTTYSLTRGLNRGGGFFFSILHISKVLSLVHLKVSLCEQEHLHTHLTQDETQNCLNNSSMSYWDIIPSCYRYKLLNKLFYTGAWEFDQILMYT